MNTFVVLRDINMFSKRQIVRINLPFIQDFLVIQLLLTKFSKENSLICEILTDSPTASTWWSPTRSRCGSNICYWWATRSTARSMWNNFHRIIKIGWPIFGAIPIFGVIPILLFISNFIIFFFILRRSKCLCCLSKGIRSTFNCKWKGKYLIR